MLQSFEVTSRNHIYWIFLQVATLIAVYANWSFAAIEGIGWGWAGVIWLYNLIFYIPLDFIKFFIRYALSGKAWDLVIEQRVYIKAQPICLTVVTSWQVRSELTQSFLWLVDCIHEAKGLWQRTTWASMGTRAENIARFTAPWCKAFPWENTFQRTQSNCGGSQKESWDSKVSRLEKVEESLW